ncbi:MAG: hypothetical protein U0271_23220 [Polyangiaceae bacterium]
MKRTLYVLTMSLMLWDVGCKTSEKSQSPKSAAASNSADPLEAKCRSGGVTEGDMKECVAGYKARRAASPLGYACEERCESASSGQGTEALPRLFACKDACVAANPDLKAFYDRAAGESTRAQNKLQAGQLAAWQSLKEQKIEGTVRGVTFTATLPEAFVEVPTKNEWKSFELNDKSVAEVPHLEVDLVSMTADEQAAFFEKNDGKILKKESSDSSWVVAADQVTMVSVITGRSVQGQTLKCTVTLTWDYPSESKDSVLGWMEKLCKSVAPKA